MIDPLNEQNDGSDGPSKIPSWTTPAIEGVKQQAKENLDKSLSGEKPSPEGLTKEEHIKKYSPENLDLSIYPQSVVLRVEKDYVNKPLAKANAYKRLSKIKMLSVNEGGNTVQIGDKIFSILQPEVDNQDVFTNKKHFPHTRYIRGTALVREVEKAGMKLFNSIEEAREFIDTYLPWSTETLRVQNFARLLWLKEYSGYRSGGRWEMWFNAYARLCYPVNNNTWYLFFSDEGRPNVSGEKGGLAINKGTYKGHEKDDILMMKDAKPVVCFKNAA